MNYSKIYTNIIERAKSRKSLEGYVEIHHIVPKCIGGDESKSNLVTLTAKEHYICHLLLAFMHKDTENYSPLVYAFNNMTFHNGDGRNTSRKYSLARKLFSENHPLKNEEIKARHKERCNDPEVLRKQLFSRHNNKLTKQNALGIFPVSDLYEGYFETDYASKIKTTKGVPKDPRYFKISDKTGKCVPVVGISKMTEEDRIIYSKKLSDIKKAVIGNMSTEEKAAYMAKSILTADPVARGEAISRGKTGRETNQKEIEIEKFGKMSESDFLAHVDHMPDNIKMKYTNRRKLYFDRINDGHND